MSLIEKMKKTGSIKVSSVLTKSDYYNTKEFVSVGVPAFDIALSGSVYGGLTSGVTMIAGQSKTFKTLMGLLMIAAYQRQYPDSICLYYVNEFGLTPSYIKASKVDPERILEIPFEDVEELRIDLTQKLDNIEKDKERVIVFVDSLGNAASRKEVTDAREGKSTVDMTRAKILRSLFRIVTPKLILRNVPAILINHTYSGMDLYAKEEVSGGEGPYYNANGIWIISRVQEKNSDNKIEGYTFNINIEKSRFVKEKSKIPVTVLFNSGVRKYSGLFELALESGHIQKPTQGFYTIEGDEKNYRRKELDTKETWKKFLQDKTFTDFIEKKYKLSDNSLISEDE